MAPGTSLFQVDDSRRWCNCIDVMFLLRKGENDIHERKPSACLCAGTIPAVKLLFPSIAGYTGNQPLSMQIRS